jgi:hypothetical protein
MAQKKTKGSDFNRGWQAALDALDKMVFDDGRIFDRLALCDMLTILRKHK